MEPLMILWTLYKKGKGGKHLNTLEKYHIHKISKTTYI
jgi:hypothetical protein